MELFTFDSSPESLRGLSLNVMMMSSKTKYSFTNDEYVSMTVLKLYLVVSRRKEIIL